MLGNRALGRLANNAFQVVLKGKSYRRQKSPHLRFIWRLGVREDRVEIAFASGEPRPSTGKTNQEFCQNRTASLTKSNGLISLAYRP